jgi:Ca2+-binding EF-hand superfamily protein
MEDLVKAFEIFEPDSSDNITVSKFKKLMTTGSNSLSSSEVTEMIKEVNVVDGKFNIKDFIDIALKK